MATSGEPESSRPPKAAPGRRSRPRFRRRELLEIAFGSVWPWGALFTVGLAVLLAPGLRFEPVRYELGQIAPATIRAPYDFSYEDRETTSERREEAAARVLEVYDFDTRAAAEARQAIARAFALGRDALADRREPLDEAERAELYARVREALGVALSEDEFGFLVERRFAPELEQSLADAVGRVLARPIVASKERLLASGRPIARRDDAAGEPTTVRDFSAILTTEEARAAIEERVAVVSDLPPSDRRRLARIGERMLLPTLSFNFAETERRRQEARDAVEPVYFQVRKGRVIVRAGDEIDERVLRQLEVLGETEGRRWRLAGLVGAVVLSILLWIWAWSLLRPARRTASWKRQSFGLVGLVVIFHLALARLVLFVGGALGEQIVTPPFNNAGSYAYLVPYAAVAVLLLLLENAATAGLGAVVFAAALGLMTGDVHLAVFALVSGLAATLGFFQYKQRTALIKAGLFVGSVNFAAALGLDLLTERYQPVETFAFDLVAAFVGGPAVAVVVSFLLPVLESLFQRTTDIKLLELANQDLPLLRRLALEAPGTYHHSVIVGSLAEAAAETIGANGVFCRTAALYHDIGKLAKVDYFVENQTGPNRHDRLSPRMSALIIANHVKEGIELAKEHNLPQEIIDIIPQHHGTKLITYFYEKAKESHDPSLGDVSEEEFRYPGPKPQTKEAGIIMIADAVEAASRTLDDPSPARLKGVIRRIIDYIFIDGQLDECDLTLRDLEKISQAFLRVLMGIYHHRVHYPGFDFEKSVEPVVVQDGR